MADNDQKDKKDWLGNVHKFRKDADKGREPHFLPARMGTRQYSVMALIEQIIDEFSAEFVVGGDSDTEMGRLKRIVNIADYVIAVESIRITPEEKAEVIRRVYAELFSFGPLDKLFENEAITTIALEGADKAFVRYGHGELVSAGVLFDDEAHLHKIVRRLLVAGGTDFYEDQPISEVGLTVGKRRLRVTVAAPPVTIQLAVDIRIHSASVPSIETLAEVGLLTSQAATLLKGIAQSSHGIVIVGDTESGKTTMLSIIAGLASVSEQGLMVAVERAEELNLPENAQRLVVQWKNESQLEQTFHDQINVALNEKPACLLLDEVRTDEPQAVASLLTIENMPRQMWVFRGPSKVKRLVPALTMLARRSDPAVGETIVHALYQRLPFVISVRRRKGQLQLYSIAEWQYSEDAEYPDYVELMVIGQESSQLTGKRPRLRLDLPENFWD